MVHDVVFKHVKVVDGSGKPAYFADVAIDEQTITAIDKTCGLLGKNEVANRGTHLAPGFIDFHSHSEWILPSPNSSQYLLPFLQQGVTTFFGGQCGYSPYPSTEAHHELIENIGRTFHDGLIKIQWENTDDFANYVESKGILLNAGLLVGHGTLRAIIKGDDPAPMSKDELKRMKMMISDAAARGAFGVTMGLAYIPGVNATDEEIRAVFEAAAENDIIVCIHGHTYSWNSSFFKFKGDQIPHNVYDVQYFCNLAVETKARLNLSHVLLKGSHTWDTCDAVLAAIDNANNNGADVTFGVIPYHWGNTVIESLIPQWFLANFHANMEVADIVERLAKELRQTEIEIGRTPDDLFLLLGGTPVLTLYNGMSFRQIGEEKGLDDIQTILWILKESDGKAKVLTAGYSGKEGEYDEPLIKLFRHEKSIFEIDAIVTSLGGAQTPAAYGAFPKVIGRYGRERGIFSVETAIHKLTGKPAKRFGLKNRGLIAEGMIADLVLFDYETIIDRNTISHPSIQPDGICQVWQAGRLIFSEGKLQIEDCGGRIIKANQ